MSEIRLGNLTVASPFMSALTSISSIFSASVSRVSDCLTSVVSLAPCTPQDNKSLTENTLQMMERNISSLGLYRFIEAQGTSWEQVKNNGRYSARRSLIRHR